MIDEVLEQTFFKGNRAKLFESLDVSLIVVSANGLLQKSADESYPFRQDSNFWYLTGINEPDLLLVITASEEFIIVPDFSIKRSLVLEPLDKAQITKTSGIKQILSETEGWAKLKSKLTKENRVATLLPSPVRLKYHGIYANPARRILVTKIKRTKPGITLVDARTQLARLRMAKQPAEIKLIQTAIDITTETLSEVLKAHSLDKYKDTAEVEKAILAGFVSRGGSGHAFDPVVASGINAAYVHYMKLGQPLKKPELLVCDVGSRYDAYNGDITRTVSLGQPTARQQAVFQAVAEVQAGAYKLIKAGMQMRDYENEVEKLVGRQLKKLGLITKINHKSVRQYYPHACSHSLGLDTHDSADYSIPLPENMVMTVEPGIYIPEEAIGVRIEDVVQITKDGYRLMSSKLPTSLKL
jgi:Xaa-Pro aminopeptidase